MASGEPLPLNPPAPESLEGLCETEVIGPQLINSGLFREAAWTLGLFTVSKETSIGSRKRDPVLEA